MASCYLGIPLLVNYCASSFSRVCLTWFFVLFSPVSLDLNMELPQGQTGSVGTSVASAEQVNVRFSGNQCFLEKCGMRINASLGQTRLVKL